MKALEEKRYETAEKDTFSAKVQIRKTGERRYGKGTIKVTDKKCTREFQEIFW